MNLNTENKMISVPGILLLKDGSIFSGNLYQHANNSMNSSGEIVFNTSMTGYQEILTDPSYTDQIIVMTAPLIGNYGANASDEESTRPHCKGFIVREMTEGNFHHQGHSTLLSYLQENAIPCLDQVDTRALTKHIRNHGAQPAMIMSKMFYENHHQEAHLKLQNFASKNPVAIVSTLQPYTLTPTNGTTIWKIALLDFGVKKNIINSLLRRQCQVTVLPYNASLKDIENYRPHGIVLSNGPGDPEDCAALFPLIKTLSEKYPTLGICLGHQLLALSYGAQTTKMTFGHRGANHPVIDLERQRTFLTSQNHGYAVLKESLKATPFQLRFVHNNDESVEGFFHPKKPILSLQFHPEANPGPEETSYLFDEFTRLLKNATSGNGEKRVP